MITSQVANCYFYIYLEVTHTMHTLLAIFSDDETVVQYVATVLIATCVSNNIIHIIIVKLHVHATSSFL